jgi:integrase
MLRASALLFGEENAKRTSPHDFRRIFCTWLYTYGNAEEQEVYAEVMGHSVEQARRTYALVRSRDKTVKVDDVRRGWMNESFG